MKKVLITLDDEEEKILTRRAKKNLFTLKEQIEDIIRRSAKRTKNLRPKDKVDDRLVRIFSRQRSGRPRKVRKRK